MSACAPTQGTPTAETTTTVPAIAEAELRRPGLARVASWAMPLGSELDENTVARLAAVDLVVVDGEETSPEQVAALKADGAIVLGYLSVGTIEPSRSWYERVEEYRLERWDDWDEYYADVSQERFRSVLMMEVAPAMLAKGFDGLFLDNVDMIREHPAQAEGMRRLLEGISVLVHREDGMLAVQNGEDVLGPLLPYIDIWNREDVTFTYDFSADEYVRTTDADHVAAVGALETMRMLGILTLTLDYPPPDDADAIGEAGDAAAEAGAISWTSDIGLTRLD